MDLRRYLFENRITAKAFAQLMDCSRQQIGLVVAGKPVGKKFARQIEKATKGVVMRYEVITREISEDSEEKSPDLTPG